MIRKLCNVLNDIGFILNEVGFNRDGHKVTGSYQRSLTDLMYKEFQFNRTILYLKRYTRYRDNGITLYFGHNGELSERIRVRFSPDINEIKITALLQPLNDIIDDLVEFRDALLARFPFHKEFPEYKNHPIKYALIGDDTLADLEYNGRLEHGLDIIRYIHTTISDNKDKNVKYNDIEYVVIDDSIIINRYKNMYNRTPFNCTADMRYKTILTFVDLYHEHGSLWIRRSLIPDGTNLQLAKKYINNHYSNKK